MDKLMTPREFTILLVSENEDLRSAARHELETVDERRHVATASSVDAARRMVEDSVPAVILLDEGPSIGLEEESMPPVPRLHAAVTSLASYAPVVVIAAAEHQNELSGLVAAGVADYVVHTEQCLHIALGLVERRLRQAQTEAQSAAHFEDSAPGYRGDPLTEFDGQDFGEVLRHELNNPLTGILGNAELLLSEIRRKSDGRLPQGAPQRLETITTLAVRLRETVRRLSQEWESRQHPVHSR
jgi:DNA-binding NarL/FixJ family response regulator